MDWDQWISRHWSVLSKGGKVALPSATPHPSDLGLRRLDIAMPAGQVADWALPLSDGSRLHVHEHLSGQLIAHRVQYDPDRGLGDLVAHLLLDTPLVPAVLLCCGVVAVARRLTEA